MTDQQKIAFLVEKLFGGKWPESRRTGYHRGPHFDSDHADIERYGFDPLHNLEDAFMVVEAMRDNVCLITCSHCQWSADLGAHTYSYADSFQQAIVEAAIAALETK